MKMEVLAVQQQFQTSYGVLGSNKVKDWTGTLTAPPTPLQQRAAASAATQQQMLSAAGLPPPYMQNDTTNKIKNSINKKNAAAVAAASSQHHHGSHHHYHHLHHHSGGKRGAAAATDTANAGSATTITSNGSSNSSSGNNSNNNNINNNNNSLFNCDTDCNIDGSAKFDLSQRLLDELRAAKSRHLTCTEVSLPCDLTPRVAVEIMRASAKEPCGIRGCTIYIEFEDEPGNSRRIATLRVDTETISTFEVYLTLRQDHRGWAALLPQFMKSLARTITISPEFTITKHKLYSPQLSSSYNYGSSGRISAKSGSSSFLSNNGPTAAISTPSS